MNDIEDSLKQFSPTTATGEYLERFTALVGVRREIYGYDENDKPNNHCFWDAIGFTTDCFAWVENDEHLRSRFKDSVE